MSGHALPPDRTGVWHRPWTGNAEPARPEPGMTVFWQDGRAIGHVLILPDGTRRLADPAEAIAYPPFAQPAECASIIICTRDRPDEVARCLASLSDQTLAPVEVIVVDNASVDERTRAAALAAGVTYVREDRPGLDYARNSGWQAATGDILVYTDDDVMLHPTWLERMVGAFDDPAIGAVTGLVLPAELASEAQFLFESGWSFGQGYRRIDFTPADFAAADHGRHCFAPWKIGAGASMAFRRSVFDRAGGFDDRLDVGQAGCSGDSEYWYRLLDVGIGCRYEPAATAFHYHRRDIAGLAKQLRAYMRGHSAALLVQYERTGRRGNLWRLMVVMPRWYLRRAARTLIGRRRREDRFLWREISGYLSGIAFYLSQPRPPYG
ncbi:glycosyltransferase family 2 protein [Sphingomonas sp. FW199]|uniref:glycosyltransferase family 2 protein n=1 Tax=Sphingomonas sp. FW199 TaxID=3400217 RepID=UPI003CEEB90B